MSQLIGTLAGAPQAANVAQGYYSNALNNEIDAAGSPAARDFARLQMATLRPEISSQDQQLSAQLAAQGLGSSGAGRNLGGQVASNEASTLAGVTAPLYQEALNQYGQINAAMPGAQLDAYQTAIANFYNELNTAASAFGAKPGNVPNPQPPAPGYGDMGYGSGGTGYYAPGDPSGVSNTPYMP